jgi:hypothetical protein
MAAAGLSSRIAGMKLSLTPERSGSLKSRGGRWEHSRCNGCNGWKSRGWMCRFEFLQPHPPQSFWGFDFRAAMVPTGEDATEAVLFCLEKSSPHERAAFTYGVSLCIYICVSWICGFKRLFLQIKIYHNKVINQFLVMDQIFWNSVSNIV